MKSSKAKFETTIQPWGNSLGLRITQPMSQLAHLGRGDTVIVEVTEEGLSVRPKNKISKQLPFTEKELIAGLTPHTAHADELPTLVANETGE